MGTVLIKHVKVSGDVVAAGPVCPFLQKQKIKTTTGSFLPSDL